MYIKMAVLLLGAVVLVHLVRRFRPTRFGVAFGLLVLYMPVHYRMPLAVMLLVNLLTAFLVTLFVLAPTSEPLGRHAARFRTLVVLCVALSCFGMVISPAVLANLAETAPRFKRWLEPALFGLLALYLARDEDRRFVLACMVIGYTAVSLHAVRESFDYGSHKRIPGLLSHPNETGAYLASYGPLLLAMAIMLSRGSLRAVLIGVVLVAAWGLVATESRGSMTGYGLGIITTLVRSGRPLLAAGGVMAALGLWAVPDLLPERVVARFESTVVEDGAAYAGADQGVFEEQLEESSANRIIQWKASLQAMASNPLGFGFDRYKDVIARFGGIRGMDAHNVFFLVGVELGVAALVVVLALFVKMGANAWVVARDARDPVARALGTGCFAMVVAAALVNFVGSRLMQEGPSTYLWMLGAVMARTRDELAPVDGASRAAASPGVTPVGRSR